jgi:hypothetical protein
VSHSKEWSEVISFVATELLDAMPYDTRIIRAVAKLDNAAEAVASLESLRDQMMENARSYDPTAVVRAALAGAELASTSGQNL